MNAPANSELTTNTHVFFLRGVFSNFTATPDMYIGGYKFQSTEQAFMFEKAKLFNDQDSMQKILVETNPAKVKQLGREVKNFIPSVWDKHKFDLMVKVNVEKYEQFTAYRQVLLATGEKLLVEANGKDTVWGIGMYANDRNILREDKWKGENLLGKALMKVREKLSK